MNAPKKAIFIADAIAARARYQDLPYIESIAPSTQEARDICENWQRFIEPLMRLDLYTYVVNAHERNFDKGLEA